MLEIIVGTLVAVLLVAGGAVAWFLVKVVEGLAKFFGHEDGGEP